MKILLFDDHRLLGESLKRLLEENEEVSRCVYADNEKDFFKWLRREAFDILLLDINLQKASGKNGFELLDDIFSIAPSLRVAILSSYDMPMYRKKAFDKGAMDFINKSIPAEELVARLRANLKKTPSPGTEQKTDLLTSREAQILREICKGKIKKDIARELYISERTLYNHIQSIYEKLNVTNGLEACRRAMELGYVEPWG